MLASISDPYLLSWKFQNNNNMFTESRLHNFVAREIIVTGFRMWCAKSDAFFSLRI